MCFSLRAQSNLDSIAWEIDVEDVNVTAQYAPTHYKNVVHAVKDIKAGEEICTFYGNNYWGQKENKTKF